MQRLRTGAIIIPFIMVAIRLALASAAVAFASNGARGGTQIETINSKSRISKALQPALKAKRNKRNKSRQRLWPSRQRSVVACADRSSFYGLHSGTVLIRGGVFLMDYVN